jgi:hypothetical protein
MPVGLLLVRQTYQNKHLMERLEIQNARTQAAKIAAAVLAGQLSPVLGAVDLNGLRERLRKRRGDSGQC